VPKTPFSYYSGVAAQNIGGQTIHSALRIHSYGSTYQTLAFSDSTFYQKLKKITTLIIDEISMASSKLFNYISQIFSYIHHNAFPFRGINVIVLHNYHQLRILQYSLGFFQKRKFF
jgi:hypothetical protein